MYSTIFVSIASYRDAICAQTVENLFESAERPFNIYVGICQQNKLEEDTDCISKYKKREWFKNISIIRISHKVAKGPTYARFLCSKLYKNEDYFLQIDSHTKFLKNWDSILLNDMLKLYNRGVLKPVLSHYPKAIEYHSYKKKKDCDVPTLCTSFFTDRKMISFPGAEIHSTQCEIMRPTAYIAGGMMFAPGSFLKEIPYDPNLDYLFVGEEILHSIRFYTHGWDIFTPSQNVLYLSLIHI
jgi:[Skp1-protein]-hydroxyproline N-acetylglucosaminyltransferase